MSSSDDNEDLQTYFDTFKGEIEESNDCVTLTAEALRALSEADAVTEKILEEDAGINTDENHSGKKSSDLLKNIDGKKGIFYLKLSNKESIQVKLIGESATSPAKDLTSEQEADDKDDDSSRTGETVKKETIYEFDEDDPELKSTHSSSDNSHLKRLATGGTVMHVVPQTNTNVTDGQIYQCKKCSYSTNKRFLLSRHLHTHSYDRPYKCSVCDRGFKIGSALVNHMNSHLGKKPHGCTYCEMRFNTSGELVRHIRYKHTGEKPHKCGECDYSSVELSKMRRHMRCHTGERPYQCPHCTYASPDTFKLKRHLRTHTGEKPYECDICLARFTQSNSLKAHRLIHTAGDRPSFQCTYCPTTCGRKSDLQLHVQKLHNPDNPVKCKRCCKELPDRYSYKVHLKTHEGEKCFRCTICPHASISQRLLDMHMLVHTDEKPFTCEQCGSCFRQRQLLVRHINLYHNDDYVPPTPSEKSHVCPHCNRAFTRKGNLMRHMETHDTQVDKEKEKLNLRIGRKIRIRSDGSITAPNSDILSCVIANDNTSTNIDSISDDVGQGDENFAILEIDDEDNVDDISDSDIVVAYEPMMKNNGQILNTIKTEQNKSIENKFMVTSSQVQQRAAIGREQKVKPEPSTVTVDVDDGNEHFMVIEVIDEDAGNDDDVIAIDSRIKDGLLELPIQSSQKHNTGNSLGFSNVNDYILSTNYKHSHITIMDVLNDD